MDLRYYTNEWTYVVGTGLRPWYGVQPRLMNEPLPDETLQGGLGSVSYDYADNATFIFQQPYNNVGMQNMQRFVEGRRWFHTNMRTGDHNETGNDRNQDAVGLQGMFFNQSTCFGCHINNGRGMAPAVVNQRTRTRWRCAPPSSTATAGSVPHPMYGAAAQMNAQPATNGVRTDWGTGGTRWRIRRQECDARRWHDGAAAQAAKVAFDGPTPSVYFAAERSAGDRHGPARGDPRCGHHRARSHRLRMRDGVKGTANYVYDPETGAVRLGPLWMEGIEGQLAASGRRERLCRICRSLRLSIPTATVCSDLPSATRARWSAASPKMSCSC